RRPMEEMPLCMRLADVLVSPRSEGTNTPLKLFSYLAAGKPIVATAIHSNTQVLTPDVALLVAPTGDALAQGTMQLLENSSLGDTLAANGQALAERMYSFDALVRGVAQVYAHVTAPAAPIRIGSPTPTPAPIPSEAEETTMMNTATRPDPIHEATTRTEPRPAYRRERVGALDLSIVIPVYNEEDNIRLMHHQLKDALDELKLTYEIFYIDDGSRDASFPRLSDIADTDPTVTIIRFRRNFGQTAAMSAGISHSQGDIIVLMDADMQNDPADIRLLLEKLDEGYDCVSGWRAHRRDPFLSRKLPSRIANGVISQVTGVKLHDYGCTLKAYRREVLENVRLYGEMHRFIPVYASWSGARIAEVPVNHRARQFGKSKYGISRTIRVVLDLLTVKFLGSYSTKPLYAFGYVGFVLGALAALSEVIALGQRILPPYVRIHDNPLMILGAILFVLGIQIVMMGLLAELIMRTYYESQNKPTYIVHSVVVGTPTGALTLPRVGATSNPLAANPFAALIPSLFGAPGQTDANTAISGAFAQPMPFASMPPMTPPTGTPMTPATGTPMMAPFATLPEMTPEAYRMAQMAAAQFAYQGMLAGMFPGMAAMNPSATTGPQSNPATPVTDDSATPTPAAADSLQAPLGV
ncbi:MAG TPA: glycosyltransferase, partial [Ktedonobacterales bacterium]|nr:glycosyltransferase [Ktedonobacterales bacterium]